MRDALIQASVKPDKKSDYPVKQLELELSRLKSDRRELRDSVEEVLEAHIGSVLVDENIALWWNFAFPPVDFRLTEPPLILVTSPRDRIARKHDVMLNPSVTLSQRDEIENSLKNSWNLSALVVEIGGVATYPATILNTRPLNATFKTAAHEWVHHYLFFHPLGRNMFSSPEMQTLNETFASMVGREIGSAAYQKLGLLLSQAPSKYPPRTDGASAVNKVDIEKFIFSDEMRKTRLRVDELLMVGMIEEAEAHMEEVREKFVANGFNIRKLNQAYFAFHGTYAESPTSASPIGNQLHRLRASKPDLKAFIGVMRQITSYKEFIETLENLERTKVAKSPILQ